MENWPQQLRSCRTRDTRNPILHFPHSSCSLSRINIIMQQVVPEKSTHREHAAKLLELFLPLQACSQGYLPVKQSSNVTHWGICQLQREEQLILKQQPPMDCRAKGPMKYLQQPCGHPQLRGSSSSSEPYWAQQICFPWMCSAHHQLLEWAKYCPNLGPILHCFRTKGNREMS